MPKKQRPKRLRLDEIDMANAFTRFMAEMEKRKPRKLRVSPEMWWWMLKERVRARTRHL